ncbi:TPT-domain-containing protein [Thozetella sp. PMI_491]|nr:TPT-domain-containing protein [Thozetella sp. PMI_491]
MLTSNLTIMFNKWLIDIAGFPSAIILTCWHMVFTTLATRILARTTNLIDNRKAIDSRTYFSAIVPIGILYSATLVLTNTVYLYLSVAFIQMIKATTPISVYAVSLTAGVEKPCGHKLINLLFIVFGVLLASLGEIHFSWIGFLFQISANILESVRTVIIQILLSKDAQKMNPLVSLYYFAPLCVVTNMIAIYFTEAKSFQWSYVSDVGIFSLLANAAVAFALNVSSVFLIGKTSALVSCLTGNLKNILLILASVLVWGTPITFMQCVGYGISLSALMYYSLGREQIGHMLETVSNAARRQFLSHSSQK